MIFSACVLTIWLLCGILGKICFDRQCRQEGLKDNCKVTNGVTLGACLFLGPITLFFLDMEKK